MKMNCSHLLSYIAEEMNEKDRKLFSEHLKNCRECSREYDQMTEAWNKLKWDFEEKSAPESLKHDVMNFVFNKSQPKNHLLVSWIADLRKQFTPLTAGIALAFAVLSCILILFTIQLKNELAATEEEKLSAEVSGVMLLHSADGAGGMVNPAGGAFILVQGEQRSLVVQLQNLPALQGSEVYQVWLLKDGKRENAGTFKPDEKGGGRLTYSLEETNQFDQIGITKEPDPFSKQPRGKKVVGSIKTL